MDYTSDGWLFTPVHILRSRTALPSYELKGEGPQSLPQAEILTNTNQNYMQNQSNTLVIEELEGLLSV